MIWLVATMVRNIKTHQHKLNNCSRWLNSEWVYLIICNLSKCHVYIINCQYYSSQTTSSLYFTCSKPSSTACLLMWSENSLSVSINNTSLIRFTTINPFIVVAIWQNETSVSHAFSFVKDKIQNEIIIYNYIL